MQFPIALRVCIAKQLVHWRLIRIAGFNGDRRRFKTAAVFAMQPDRLFKEVFRSERIGKNSLRDDLDQIVERFESVTGVVRVKCVDVAPIVK